MTKHRVIESYQSAYPTPIHFSVGDKLIVGRMDDEYVGWVRVVTDDGNEGWAPEQYIDVTSKPVKASHSYDATELSVQVEQLLIVHYVLNDWAWSENGLHQCGWVPCRCLQQV